jgi:hypothetical protein
MTVDAQKQIDIGWKPTHLPSAGNKTGQLSRQWL